MNLRVDIISIGTLSRNLLWNEAAGSRTAHATCSLIRAGKRSILINPGLPAVVLRARLHERTGLPPEKVTDVFLTHVGNDSVAGLELFEKAAWWCGENEYRSIQRRSGADSDDAALAELVRRLDVAPDKVAPGIDLFPLHGYTHGTCGLLISASVVTTLITGPAVASLDHFLAGQVLPECVDVNAAKESLTEVYEIADVIVPGYDNTFQNPRQFGG
jgi:glyoxylase-like metal-dependent hydrolase (beta-lactamase superfamily II)